MSSLSSLNLHISIKQNDLILRSLTQFNFLYRARYLKYQKEDIVLVLNNISLKVRYNIQGAEHILGMGDIFLHSQRLLLEILILKTKYL